MRREAEREKLQKILTVINEPEKWRDTDIEKLVLHAVNYERVFSDDQRFDYFRPVLAQFIPNSELARNLPDYTLRHALDRRTKREILTLFIQSFVRNVPNGRVRAKRAISDFIHQCAQMDALYQIQPTEFTPCILASQFSQGVNNGETDHALVTQAAVKTAIRDPSFIEKCEKFVRKYFIQVDVDDLVQLALSSENGMKCVLSSAVPLITSEGGSIKAKEVLQRLASRGGKQGEPARLVADLVKRRTKIDCLVNR